MLLSRSHSFIFFHVAKVGGISIRHVLKPYTCEPEHFKINRPPRQIKGKPNRLYAIWESALIHATVKQTQTALPSEFNTFYKFAFVRNPWDWQVSMYHFLLKQPDNHRYQMIKEFGSFKQYMQWVVNEDRPFPKGATKLQSTMLIGADGKIAVDKIGRFETLAEDFQTIGESLGIQVTLPKLNYSLHTRYQDYYDTATKHLVEKHFSKDIELFEYTFN
jgi:hypothetical protein